MGVRSDGLSATCGNLGKRNRLPGRDSDRHGPGTGLGPQAVQLILDRVCVDHPNAGIRPGPVAIPASESTENGHLANFPIGHTVSKCPTNGTLRAPGGRGPRPAQVDPPVHLDPLGACPIRRVDIDSRTRTPQVRASRSSEGVSTKTSSARSSTMASTRPRKARRTPAVGRLRSVMLPMMPPDEVVPVQLRPPWTPSRLAPGGPSGMAYQQFGPTAGAEIYAQPVGLQRRGWTLRIHGN